MLVWSLTVAAASMQTVLKQSQLPIYFLRLLLSLWVHSIFYHQISKRQEILLGQNATPSCAWVEGSLLWTFHSSLKMLPDFLLFTSPYISVISAFSQECSFALSSVTET